MNDVFSPPNITARSLSVKVRENSEQGGGRDPFTGWESHCPKAKWG